MTRREYKVLLAMLKAEETVLNRDEHGKLLRLLSKKELLELHALGYLDEPKNFLDEKAYIDMLHDKTMKEKIAIYGE